MAASLGVSWSSSTVVGYSPDSNNMSTEAEESPLLRCLACAVVICKVWRLAIVL
jgi:hypothetical protein